MCFKKWCKPDPVGPVPEASKRALLFGINDYKGSGNDLNGCLNDVDDVEKKLLTDFSGFVISKFKDSQVTCDRFYNEIKNALSVSRPGDFLMIHYSGHGTTMPSNHEPDGYDEALYLYDGPFMDDRMTELQQMTPEGVIVCCKLDSCFSGGMSRVPVKNRFFQLPGMTRFRSPSNRLAKADSKWVIFSGCGEGQTSADAFINGRYNGAFTYYDNLSYGYGFSFKEEITKIKTHLPGHGFDQAPELLGNSQLFNYKLKTIDMKAVYDKNAPTKNLVTTISGIVTLLSRQLRQLFILQLY
jgi:hypothetical protein